MLLMLMFIVVSILFMIVEVVEVLIEWKRVFSLLDVLVLFVGMDCMMIMGMVVNVNLMLMLMKMFVMKMCYIFEDYSSMNM